VHLKQSRGHKGQFESECKLYGEVI
jgi:hypothetical protein